MVGNSAVPYRRPGSAQDPRAGEEEAVGTFRICYESNAARKFDSARNRFVETDSSFTSRHANVRGNYEYGR